MKKITLLFFILLFSHSFAQDNNLIGKWQVISVDNGDVFYNIQNDSIKVYDSIKEQYNDSSKIDTLKDMIKMVYFTTTFIFEKEGKYVQKSEMATFNLLYKIDKGKGTILLSNDKLNFDSKTTLMYYKIVDSKLYLETTDTEPSTKFVLKK